MLPALDVAGVDVDLALGQRDVLVGAQVADRVDVVVDADDADARALDVNSCASPSVSSSRRQMVTSGIGDALVVQLLADASADRGREPGRGQPAHDLVEEAGDDEPVGDLGRHARLSR